ncbi:transglycosylase domain-containing protein [Propioniciclava sp.]|uniref:transglycosylase domain-containing protein n=1 Tax=Propioniciclava sp. TaxID=2038686 RepID=UPI00261CA062|nr:transglycosylase domain-containing protein [Propioniciclava sp.]
MAEPTPKRVKGTKASGNAATRGRRSGKSVALSIFKWLGAFVVLGGIAALAAFGVIYATTEIPDPNKDFQTNVTRVYYSDGTTEISSFAIQNRESIPLDQMSKYAQDAVVASENETFWTDPGISVPGLMRAVQTAITPGADTVGGSTITQQYVKVLYLTQEKTLTRKLKEIVIALKVSREVPKEQILAGYLNTVYYGRGAYGLQAASKVYFGVNAADLNLGQAAALTAIINSPNNLDPAKGEQQAADLLERYQYTLNQMVKTGTITDAQRLEIYDSLPEFPTDLATDSRFGGPKGYLMDMVEKELQAKGFSEDQIRGGGLNILTTVSATAQQAAQDVAQASAERAAKPKGLDPNSLHPAIASIDTATGGIIALYGGPDFTTGRNWATTPRPTGSTFKPWSLVAGLRQGATLNTVLNGNEFTPPGESKPISNAGGSNYGPVTLQKATTSSINSAYVDLVLQMDNGPESVIQAAEDAGLTNHDWAAVPAITLGFGEVAPVEAARGLATLVNGGQRTDTHIVAEVKDLNGAGLYTAQVNPQQTIEADVAQNAVAALKQVTTSGTGRTAGQLGVDVAGKTGTYYDSDTKQTKASWFIGSTAQISTAVMFVAGDKGTGDLDDFSSGFYGSGFPAQTWLAYMKVAQAGLPEVELPDATATQRSSGRFSAAPAPARTTTPVASEEPTAEPTDTPSPEPTAEPTDAPTDAPTAEPTLTEPAAGPTESVLPPGQGGTPPGRRNG